VRTSINNYSNSLLPNENVEASLKETDQFYKELSMANQFSVRPLVMPLPHKCISRLTYRLAVTLAMLKTKHSKLLKTLFNQNELLTQLTQEIQNFVA
jgi:hypothetical protein